MEQFLEQAKANNWEEAYSILITTRISRWSISLRRRELLSLFSNHQQYYERKCYNYIQSMLESAKESL